MLVLQWLDEATGIARRDHQDDLALCKGREHLCQIRCRQIFERNTRLVQHQLVVRRAVAGEIEKDQVFFTAAFGQRANRSGQVLPGRQRAVGQMVAVVDQAYLAMGGEALGEQLLYVIGFAHEHVLPAIARHGQRIKVLGRAGRR